MFDQNDPNQPTTDATATPVVDPAQPSTDPVQASPAPQSYNDPQSPVPTTSADPMSDQMPSAPVMDTPEASAPADMTADMTSDTPVFNTTSLPALEDASAPTSSTDMATPVASDPMPVESTESTETAASADAAEPITPSFSDTTVATDPAPALDASGNDLLGLKQQALQSLSPLLSHLDQTPEEKFRTTMMMIQASDDQSLVQAAYDAANAIPDEKAKAQALLDVVNEINYFTQAKPGTQTPVVN